MAQVKKVQRIDGMTGEEYGNRQTQILDDFLGLGFDDLPKKPDLPVFCVTFRQLPLKLYYLEIRAVDLVAAREYALTHFPLDLFHSYPRELFESLYPAWGQLRKLGEITL